DGGVCGAPSGAGQSRHGSPPPNQRRGPAARQARNRRPEAIDGNELCDFPTGTDRAAMSRKQRAEENRTHAKTQRRKGMTTLHVSKKLADRFLIAGHLEALCAFA